MRFADLIRLSTGSTAIKLMGAATAFAVTVIVTRSMDKIDSGLAFSLVAAYMIASVLGRYGLDNVMLRYGATLDGRNGFVFRHAFGLVFMLSMLLGSVIGFGMSLHDGFVQAAAPTTLIVAFAVATVFTALTVLASFVLRSQGHTMTSVWLQSGSIPAGVAVILLGLLAGDGIVDPTLLMVAYAASSTLAFAIAAVYLRHMIAWPSRRDMNALQGMRRDASPLAVTAAMQVATQWLPALLLLQWASAQAVADYHVAARVTFLSHFILFGITTVAAPHMARMHGRGDMIGLRLLYQRTVWISLFAGGLPLMLVILFPGYVLALFGSEYSGTAILRIFALGQIVNMACGPVMNLLMMSGEQKAVRNTAVTGGLSAIALCIVLIPNFGGAGAAVAVATSIVIQNLLATWHAGKHLNIGFLAFRRKLSH